MPDEPTIRLGAIATFEMGQSPPSSVVVDGYRGVPFLQGCAEFGQQYARPHCSCLRPPKVCKKGDVLISVRAPVGTINKADREYCIGRGLAAVWLPEDYPENYGWHLLGYWAPGLRRVSQGTTFEAVGRNDLENLEIVDIRPEDRAGLVAVLDTADEAIAKTEALIAKLKSIKQGLLHDLLTRGLDDNGELRDPEKHPEDFKNSELGKIPESWKIHNLGELAVLVTSGSRNWARYYSADPSTALFLRIGNLTRDHVNLKLDEKRYVNPPKGTEGHRTQAQANDVLISITADLGIIGVVPAGLGETYINQHIALVRLNDKHCNQRWVAHYLTGHAAQQQFNRLNDIGAKAGLGLPAITRLLFAIPENRSEQERISEVLDNLDRHISSEQVALRKYADLKKGLMADLLTGRVRVPADKVLASATG